MNRRGDEHMHMLTGIVLLVAVILLAVAIFFALKNMTRTSLEGAECATQIRAHVSTVRLTKGLKSPQIVCPTEIIPVKEDEDPRERIAQSMKSCWDMWGRGTYNLFGDEDGLYCHICAIVKKDQEVTGLSEYLHNTNIPQSNPLKPKETYEQYFKPVKVIEGSDKIGEVHITQGSEVTYPEHVSIGVIFYQIKGYYWYETFFNTIIQPENAAAIGATAGGLVGYGVIAAAPVEVGFIASLGIVTTGSAAGGWLAVKEALGARILPDRASAIVIRPMTEDDIRLFGCTYAPVANPS